MDMIKYFDMSKLEGKRVIFFHNSRHNQSIKATGMEGGHMIPTIWKQGDGMYAGVQLALSIVFNQGCPDQ